MTVLRWFQQTQAVNTWGNVWENEGERTICKKTAGAGSWRLGSGTTSSNLAAKSPFLG